MGVEMIFIFLLALILFGPKKLPEMAREVGKFMAEFKRASNDFKYQLQNELETAANDSPKSNAPAMGTASNAPALAAPQQTTSFTQTLLPPSVKDAISNIDVAHDRLMKTARMAFDAQSFSLRPPEAPVVASTEAEVVAETPADPYAPGSNSGVTAASHESSPVEAATDQPTPNAAPAQGHSAPQSS